MTGTATANVKMMTDGQRLEFKDHLTTFMERMVDEFDSMKWGYDAGNNDLMLGGDAMLATTLHAVLITSFSILLKAGCPKAKLGRMVLEAMALIPNLQTDLVATALMNMVKDKE